MAAARLAKGLLPPRLTVAFVISLLLHLSLLLGQRLELSPPPDLKRLEARLVRTAPELKPGDTPPPTQPRAKKPKPKPREVPAQVLPQAELPEPPTREAPPPEPEPPEVAEIKPEANPSPTPPEETKVTGTAWPRAGRITFGFFMGEKRFEFGKSTHQWEVQADGKYVLMALTEPVGVAVLPGFNPGRKMWESRGRVTETGLQPESFVERQEGRPGDQRAELDWVAKELRIGHSVQPLPERTQDVLSVFYQLGYPGAAEPGELPVTTGRKLDAYRFERLGEETLSLPFGMAWRTVHLRAQYGNEVTEVWIAPDYFGLPVQIRNVDRKGVIYYLIANDVMVAQDALDRKNP